MIFTTTTEIAKKGSKAFENITYATVLSNNTDIGMIIGGDLYKLILEKGIIDDLIEDMEIKSNSEKLKNKYLESSKSGLSNLVI